jgi:hypothetical protein
MDTEKGLMIQTEAVLNHSFMEGFRCGKGKIKGRSKRISEVRFWTLVNQNCQFLQLALDLDSSFILPRQRF